MFDHLPAFDQVTPNEHPLLGRGPNQFWGTGAPDGDASPWKDETVGSLYVRKVSATVSRVYLKIANAGADADWAAIAGSAGATGVIPVPLTSVRELSSDDIINAAGIGGILSKNSTPIFEKVNGATDGAMRLNWATSNSDVVSFQSIIPPDLDTAFPVIVRIKAAMQGVTDTPAIAVDSWWDFGDTKVADTTAAVTGTTIATYSATIAAADLPAAPYVACINLTPGAHATASHALYVYAIWLEYTRK